MENLEINRSNFKTQRQCYGISLKDISDKCKLSEGAVRNYEVYGGTYTNDHRTRDYNERLICNTLKDLIEGKIASAFDKNKEETTMTITRSEYVYDRSKVYAIIKKYLDENDISMCQFAEMCGVSNNIFSPSIMKHSPNIYSIMIHKICEATGWSMSMFDSCKNKEAQVIVKKPNANKKEEKVVEKTTAEPIKKEAPVITGNKEETRDRKFIFEDGCFYEEYTIVRRVRKSITRGEFMSAIEKEDK